MTNVAVLGAGKIGEALLAGLLATGHPVAELTVSERDPERAAEVADRHGVSVVDVATAAARADVLVVAVKPQDVGAVLDALTGAAEAGADGGAGGLRPGAVLVSLCAGLPTALFERRLPPGVAVVRVMPNTPMLVGEAMSAISPGRAATGEHLALVERLLGAVGRVVRVPEPQQDIVTALSGSGPAYFYYLVESMIDAGVLAGMSRPVATELVVQTALGAARMLRESGEHPTLLREAVTSPAGTTAMAIRELDRGGVRAAVLGAVEAARERSRELGLAADVK